MLDKVSPEVRFECTSRSGHHVRVRLNQRKERLCVRCKNMFMGMGHLTALAVSVGYLDEDGEQSTLVKVQKLCLETGIRSTSTPRTPWQTRLDALRKVSPSDSEGGPSQIPNNRIHRNLAEWVHNKESFESSQNFESESSSNILKTGIDFLLKQSEEYHREHTRKAIARGDIRLRKGVNVVRHFPLGYGRNAAPVSAEEIRRRQQAWIKEQRRKS
ncbi:Uncharacterized protein TCM_023563 [Theobroma cacao]|uniref:Uncharacterized protein n=1 Tax=Theobroma cacao TaxID=3641 RepID=A0A061EUD2_THECC|nr:Uncharacterized protein TCM_023563 [Theobroma cacao]